MSRSSPDVQNPSRYLSGDLISFVAWWAWIVTVLSCKLYIDHGHTAIFISPVTMTLWTHPAGKLQSK